MSPLSAHEIQQSAVHAVFRAIARNVDLHAGYVLKGGLALWLAYGSPRSSTDLDFNAVVPTANVITEETSRGLLDFCRMLDAALKDSTPWQDLKHLETADVELSTEMPALLGHIVYAASDGWSGAIPMQLTLSEIICATEVRQSGGIPVHVASLADIVAEKLKALLQQVPRDTIRSTDVYDLWYFTSQAKNRVRAEDVTPILLEKRKQWPAMPVVSKSRYRSEDLIEHSQAEYDEIRDLLDPGARFVPFDEAFEHVLAFVDRLQVPD